MPKPIWVSDYTGFYFEAPSGDDGIDRISVSIEGKMPQEAADSLEKAATWLRSQEDEATIFFAVTVDPGAQLL